MSAETEHSPRPTLVDLLSRRRSENKDRETLGDHSARRERYTPPKTNADNGLGAEQEAPVVDRKAVRGRAGRSTKGRDARQDTDELPLPLPLPRRAPRRSWGTLVTFMIFVALPVLVSTIYYFAIATPQYVSEFRFAVRDAQTSVSGQSDSLIGLTMGRGGGQVLENYMVVEYLLSEPAVEELQKRIDIRRLYSREGIDWYSRLNPSVLLEGLVAYWNGMVRSSYDQVTGISMVQVRAFRAEDALLIATTMVDMSEELITGVARRPQRDAVRFAEEDLQRAQDRLKLVSSEMTRFRDTERVIEPSSNLVLSNTQLASALRANISQLQTELSSLTNQKLAPQAPARLVLESRLKAVKEQLAVVENEVGAPRENAKPLSRVVGLYEQLELERSFAQESVKSALRNLEAARANALIQHMYVTPFVKPVLPESPTRPRRLLAVLLVAMICLLAWSAGLLLFRSVREHIA